MLCATDELLSSTPETNNIVYVTKLNLNKDLKNNFKNVIKKAVNFLFGRTKFC